MSDAVMAKEALVYHTLQLLEGDNDFGNDVGIVYQTKFFSFQLLVDVDKTEQPERDQLFRDTVLQLVHSRPELLLNVLMAEKSQDIHTNLGELERWVSSRACELRFVNEESFLKRMRTKFFMATGIWI